MRQKGDKKANRAITRRELLLQAAGMAAAGIGFSSGHKPSLQASTLETGVPKRILGKTGIEVSQLSFGCGGRFIKGFPSEDKALEALNWAFSKGINFFDTAHTYGNGESERRLGLFLKNHRNQVFVATKLEARDPNTFRAQFEVSLKRLQTDQVDLLNIHGLRNMDEVASIGTKEGIYRSLMRLKEEGGARFIGFSCHSDGQTAKAAIERYDFDFCTLQLNAAKIGGFEDTALPAAFKRKVGVVAIKVTGAGKLLGDAPGKGNIEELLNDVWNLPVASIILGMANLKMVEQDIEWARNFKPVTRREREALRVRTAGSRADLERFFRHHSDFETG